VRFEPTPIDGVFVVDLEPLRDERGFFARAFCVDELEARGLAAEVVQANLSANVQAGTVRGLHYQSSLAPEAKFFRCIRGETFNVAVDLREGSPTYAAWFGVHLSADNRRALYVPPLCAAGYQAQTDDAEVLYLASARYTPEAERGRRHDDPAFGIAWPLAPTLVSEKDRSWPLLEG
jgi:dTDP-4-dehydrorhamnose 3,5-epimerase